MTNFCFVFSSCTCSTLWFRCWWSSELKWRWYGWTPLGSLSGWWLMRLGDSESVQWVHLKSDVAIPAGTGRLCGLGASFGEVSSILAMPSIIEPWLCTRAIDGSGCTSCTVVPCQLLFWALMSGSFTPLRGRRRWGEFYKIVQMGMYKTIDHTHLEHLKLDNNDTKTKQ